MKTRCLLAAAVAVIAIAAVKRRINGVEGGVPHIDRERDRLSDASM